jgi:hypothetical protein
MAHLKGPAHRLINKREQQPTGDASWAVLTTKSRQSRHLKKEGERADVGDEKGDTKADT